MTSNPPPPSDAISGVSVLLIDAGRVLLVRRGSGPNRGLWALPGGRIEPGESAAAAAVREVREETGIAIEGPRQIDTVPVTVPGDSVSGDLHFSVAVFSARFAPGLPAAGDDASDARWVGLSELGGLALTEGTKAVIARHVAETTDA